MSKYNNYAQRLNIAFCEAREEYNKAWYALQEAQVRLEKAKGSSDEVERRNAEIAANRAARDFDVISKRTAGTNASTPWERFDSTVKELTKALKAELEGDFALDAGEMDHGAVELMKSGAMSGNDYVLMAEKFAGNHTMKCIMKPFLHEAMRNEQDYQKRQSLIEAIEKTKNDSVQIMDTWNSLLDTAKIYSGRRGSDESGILNGYSAAISKHWSDDNIQDAIREF